MRLRLKDALAMGCVWVMRVRLELFEGLVKDYGVCVQRMRLRWTYAFRGCVGDMRLSVRLDFCYCPQYSL